MLKEANKKRSGTEKDTYFNMRPRPTATKKPIEFQTDPGMQATKALSIWQYVAHPGPHIGFDRQPSCRSLTLLVDMTGNIQDL